MTYILRSALFIFIFCLFTVSFSHTYWKSMGNVTASSNLEVQQKKVYEVDSVLELRVSPEMKPELSTFAKNKMQGTQDLPASPLHVFWWKLPTLRSKKCKPELDIEDHPKMHKQILSWLKK